MKQEIANTSGRFTTAEIRANVLRDKGKPKTENRAKSPTAKGIKFPDLAGSTRPAVSTRSTAKKAPPDTSVTNARLRLLKLQARF